MINQIPSLPPTHENEQGRNKGSLYILSTYAHMHTHHIYKHTCMHTHTHTRMHTSTHTRARTHAHTHTHTPHTQTYTHSLTDSAACSKVTTTAHQCGRDSPTPIAVYIRSRVGCNTAATKDPRLKGLVRTFCLRAMSDPPPLQIVHDVVTTPYMVPAVAKAMYSKYS